MGMITLITYLHTQIRGFKKWLAIEKLNTQGAGQAGLEVQWKSNGFHYPIKSIEEHISLRPPKNVLRCIENLSCFTVLAGKALQ